MTPIETAGFPTVVLGVLALIITLYMRRLARTDEEKEVFSLTKFLLVLSLLTIVLGMVLIVYGSPATDNLQSQKNKPATADLTLPSSG
jgi:nitrate reductase gamma subunit